MEKLYIIKIGGNVLDSPTDLERFLDDFTNISARKILVHGGGKIATKLAEELKIPVQMNNGRRITDEANLRVIVMVYAGLINKNMVANLQARKCNAIGLTGADLNSIQAVKRAVKEVDYGWVGDVVGVNAKAIQDLLENEFSPIFAPITHNLQGNLLNTNADTIASALAVGLANLYETELVYCFEKKGVLQNPKDDDSLIKEITWQTYQDLKANGTVSDGMLPKLDNAFDALKKGVSKVHIAQALQLGKLAKPDFVSTVLY